MKHMEKKKDSRKYIISCAVIAAAACILICILVPSGRTGGQPQQAPATEIEGDGMADKTGGDSETCPLSSSGIPLCELNPEQRRNEELKDLLNARLTAKAGEETTGTTLEVEKVLETPPKLQAKLRFRASIPSYDHADMIAERLKNVDGVLVVYWSPPDIFDVEYDPSKLSPRDIISVDMLREYNASIISTG